MKYWVIFAMVIMCSLFLTSERTIYAGGPIDEEMPLETVIEAVPEVSIIITDEEGRVNEPTLGVCYDAHITITNPSTDAVIIVRGLEMEDQLADITRWLGSVYGSVSYDQQSDTWNYNGMAQMLTQPIFTTSFILPGDSLTTKRRIAFFDDYLKATVKYQSMTLAEASKAIYFPLEGDFMGAMFKQVDLMKENLNALKGKLKDPHVIFPNYNMYDVKSVVHEEPFELHAPPFDLEAAIEEVGFNPIGGIYWNDEGGWVLMGDGREDMALYRPYENEVVQLPASYLGAYILIDNMGEKIDFILPMGGYQDFEALPARIEGPGYFNPGTTAIAKEKVLPLLEKALNRGDALEVVDYDPNGLGIYHYLVIGGFDASLRQDYAHGTYDYRMWYESSPDEETGTYYLSKASSGYSEEYPAVAVEEFTDVNDLRSRLSRLAESANVLVLPSGKDAPYDWLETGDLENFFEVKGITLSFPGVR